MFRINLLKHADNLMASVATCRPYTGEARVRSPDHRYGIRAGRLDTGAGPPTPQEIRFSSLGIIPPLLHTHVSFIYH